jgi:GNAT superfamily N-acetyltransferase
MEVREARADERDDALNVLDAAMLDTRAVDGATLLVAVEEGRVLGALSLVEDRIDAVAVRRRRRGQGIGTVLVEAAAARRERLLAEFDAGVVPFYESLGFAVESTGGDRYRGARDGTWEESPDTDSSG